MENEENVEYKLSEKGLKYAWELIKTKKECRYFFLSLITNDIIKFMRENASDPVKIIRKILETDLRLRMEGIDWEEFLEKLKLNEEGVYVIEEGD